MVRGAKEPRRTRRLKTPMTISAIFLHLFGPQAVVRPEHWTCEKDLRVLPMIPVTILGRGTHRPSKKLVERASKSQ